MAHGNTGIRKSLRHRKLISTRCREYQSRVKKALSLLDAFERGFIEQPNTATPSEQQS